MAGGLGSDLYYVDDETDLVVENVDEGIDEVVSSVNHALSPGVEDLTLTGMDSLWGNGNDLDNRILGNWGDNTLNGGGLGNDTLDGLFGTDTLYGGEGDDLYLVNNSDTQVIIFYILQTLNKLAPRSTRAKVAQWAIPPNRNPS